jgi:predicted dehydrogenase
VQSAPFIIPYIIGRGLAGQAINKSLAVLATLDPDLHIAPARFAPRDANVAELGADLSDGTRRILAIANPHGLHAPSLRAADTAGFTAILCEKPACTTTADIVALRTIRTPVAVAHVYRQMWGVQQLRARVASGELGEIISLEGRYWQSSGVTRPTPTAASAARAAWKSDAALGGAHDTLIDLGTHWLDAACFVVGAMPSSVRNWLSYKNAPSPNRDTHAHITADFPNGTRAFVSASKAMHGAANDFELSVIGTRGSATWLFMRPDELCLGEGSTRRFVQRQDRDHGAHHPAHHGLGWIEGYIEIWRQLLGETVLGQPASYPRLSENLDMLAALLSGE